MDSVEWINNTTIDLLLVVGLLNIKIQSVNIQKFRVSAFQSKTISKTISLILYDVLISESNINRGLPFTC